MSEEAPKINIPQVKGLKALLQKTQEAAAEVPDEKPPEQPPKRQPAPYNPEELEAVDQRAQKGESFTGAEVERLLDSLEMYAHGFHKMQHESNFFKTAMLALAHKSGGVTYVRGGWIERIQQLVVKGLKPQINIKGDGKGGYEFRLTHDPESIVLASQVPPPRAKMVTKETAKVFKGGGRRYFTKRAAARNEARCRLKGKCDCHYENDTGYQSICRFHGLPEDRRERLVNWLTKRILAQAKL